MAILTRSYNLVSLRDFVEAHRSGALDALPPKALVLTFNDGHRGNYALRSLLRDLPAPPTIFLCSGVVDNCNGAKAWAEINDSKGQLESSYGLSIFALSYPNGDYSSREITLAQRAGYACGLSVDHGFNSARTDLYRIRRIAIDDADGSSKLVVKACGLWGFFKGLVVKQSYGYTESPAVEG